MAIPVARVHLAVAHAALPALLPTPPRCKMLPLLRTPCPCPCPCVAAILPAKPRRADSDERWDARKTKPASKESSASSSATAGRGSSWKSATSLPPAGKPGRADAVERWDAHKKAAGSSSPPPPSSDTSSRASRSNWPIPIIAGASSAERWDVHKKPRALQAELLDDGGESSSTGSNDVNMDEEEEEILWKPRAMYAGPDFAAAAPVPSVLPMPTGFLVHAA